jgi:hypothetical protein
VAEADTQKEAERVCVCEIKKEERSGKKSRGLPRRTVNLKDQQAEGSRKV